MEVEGIEETAAPVGRSKNNRIQVSAKKKPLYFYVNLAKRYMQHYDEVELSALGMAIGTVVTVAEILKNNGLANEIKISTSTVVTNDEAKGRRKAKIEIVIGKNENFKDTASPEISKDATSSENAKSTVVTKDEAKGRQKAKIEKVMDKSGNSKDTTSSGISTPIVTVKDDAKEPQKAKVEIVQERTDDSKDTTPTEISISTAVTKDEAKDLQKDKDQLMMGKAGNSSDTTSIEISTSTAVVKDEAKLDQKEAKGRRSAKIGTAMGNTENSKDTTFTSKVVDDQAFENEIHM